MASAPRRPRYFSGQLLTPDDFEAEQSYHLEARRRHDRHLHGWGVVCGLDLAPSGSGGIVVEPGLAIDGLGRSIVVAEPREVADPRRPTDDRGNARGPAIGADVVTLSIAYAERPDDETDPYRFVRETYVLDVHPGRTPAHRPGDHCVPLASIAWRDGVLDVASTSRRILRSTDDLLGMVLSLSRRVRALEQRP